MALMERVIWGAVIGALIGGAIGACLSAIYKYAAKHGRPVVDFAKKIHSFRHAWWFRIPAWIGFLAAVFLTSIAFFDPPKSGFETVGLCVLVVLFGACASEIYWEGKWFQIGVSDHGLDCHSPWRAGRMIPWSEVRSISFSRSLQWFIIEAEDGWKFRIPWFIAGMHQFLDICESRLRLDKLEKARPGYEFLKRAFPAPEIIVEIEPDDF